MSNWWFAQTSASFKITSCPTRPANSSAVASPAAICSCAAWSCASSSPSPSSALARGYLIGSGWSSYQKTGEVCGIKLPTGLRQADRLAAPIFTPTTKAPKGEHDMPINDAQGAAAIGAALYEKVKATSLALYRFGHDRAKQAGMILADTKFEFGTDAAGNLFLIDEVLTPDSSRYWPADSYAPTSRRRAYDKQFVRDHLVAIKWNQSPPAPRLPADVIARTQEKYLAALKNLLG